MATRPPIKLKQSPSNSAAQTLTATSSAQDVRLLVRETLRISANLASSPPGSAAHPLSSSSSSLLQSSENSSFGLLDENFVNSSLRLICCEEIDGRRWKYVAEKDASGRFRKGSIRALSSHSPQAPPIEVRPIHSISNSSFFKKKTLVPSLFALPYY